MRLFNALYKYPEKLCHLQVTSLFVSLNINWKTNDLLLTLGSILTVQYKMDSYDSMEFSPGSGCQVMEIERRPSRAFRLCKYLILMSPHLSFFDSWVPKIFILITYLLTFLNCYNVLHKLNFSLNWSWKVHVLLMFHFRRKDFQT